MYQIRDINGNVALETSTVSFPPEVINGGPLLPNTYMFPANYKPASQGDNLVTLGSNTWQLENGNYLKFEHVFSPYERVILTFSTVPDFSTQRIYFTTPVDSNKDFIGIVFYPDSSSPKIVGLLEHQDGSTPYNPNRWLITNIEYGEPYGEMWDLLFNGYVPDTANGNAEGGQGNDDDHTDTIDFPSLPSVGILSTGVYHPYGCTAIEMATIMGDLWDDSILTAIKKAFDEPFDAIVSAGILPFDLADYCSTSPSQIQTGNVTLPNSQGKALTQEWVELNGGSCQVRERWGTFIDYNSSIDIYIPFCGTHRLDIQEVMGSELTLKYHINILTGDVVALLKVNKYVNKNISKLQSVLYQFTGNCLVTIPVTGANYNQKYASIMQSISMAMGTVATLPVAGTAAGASAGATALSAIGGGSSMASNVLGGNSKTQIQRTGAYSPTTEFCKVLEPYLIIHRDVPVEPVYYDDIMGRPSIIGTNSSLLKGFVQLSTSKLDGIPCTDAERTEIKSLLESGVFF